MVWTLCIIGYIISGFSQALSESVDRYNTRMIKNGILEQVVPEPDLPYPYKYDLPREKSYARTLPDSYWSNWTKNPYTEDVLSWISWRKLEEEAKGVEYPNVGKLNRVVDILKNGASLGCVGTGRLPSRVRNSVSVQENGSKVADQLQDWVKSGIVAGPFTDEEMPFPEFKVNPMSVAPKPGGKIRIILDLSAPHGIPLDSPLPNSVNMGIDSRDLVTSMSSLKQVCERIWETGYPLEFCKADYNSAYKHISVKHQDRHLQVVEFCGRNFIELQLTFGSRSSPDRFDAASDIPLEVSLIKTGIRRQSVIKQLDDVVGFGRLGCGVVGRFYNNFRATCEAVGVSLAEETDKEKAFGPSVQGVVLGIDFNLSNLTWAMPAKKARRLLALLWQVLIDGKASRKVMESVVGKITHYMVLIPFGKWERSWLLSLLEPGSRDPSGMVALTSLAKEQVKWWIRSVHLAEEGNRIPDPRRFSPRVFLSMFPDAAGGLGDKKLGAGSWFMTSNQQPWVYLPWPALVRDNEVNSAGVRFASKLSTLEAFAALMGLVSEPDLVRNKRVIIFSDNSGFVFSFLNGNSRCGYLHTVSKALHYVAAALNTDLFVEKIPRRSDLGPVVADELSKGNVAEALGMMGDPCPTMSLVPSSLTTWIEDPHETRTLGEKIVDEMAQFTEVLDWGQF